MNHSYRMWVTPEERAKNRQALMNTEVHHATKAMVIEFGIMQLRDSMRGPPGKSPKDRCTTTFVASQLRLFNRYALGGVDGDALNYIINGVVNMSDCMRLEGESCRSTASPVGVS